jgi:formylglycine-generating enzyme required for sulfatase activity
MPSFALLPTRSALGRADLLRLYAREGRAGLTAAAGLLGYEEETPPLLPSLLPEALPAASPTPLPPLELSEAPPVARASGRYFAVAERENYQIGKDGEDYLPSWLEAAQVLVSDHRPAPGSVVLPHPLPLVRDSRLLPYLARQLAVSRSGRQPDLDRILGDFARGRLLHRLPYTERRVFSPRLCVLLDIQPDTWPYRDDFIHLYYRLLRLRGKDGLEIRVLESPPDIAPTWRLPAGGPPRRWVMPGFDVPLLILSDLGCNRNDPRLLQGWLRFGRQIKAAGIRPLVLCPAPAWRHPAALLGLYDIVAWDECAGRLRRTQPGQPRPAQSRAATVATLLALASPVIQVEPALLRALRRLLPAEAADAGYEADVWNHPDVEGDILWYRLADPEAIARHQARFSEFYREQPEWVRQAVALIQSHHANLPDSMRLAELWVCELLAPGVLDKATRDAAERWAADIVKTCRERGQDIPALGDWAWRQMPRYVGQVLQGNRQAAALWAWIHEPALKNGETLVPPEGLDLSELPLLLGQTGVRRRAWLCHEASNDLVLAADAGGHPPARLFGELELAGELLSVRHCDVRGSHSRLLSIQTLPATLGRLDRHTEWLDIVGAAQRVRVQGVDKPEWAASIRRDAHGLIAFLPDGSPARWREAQGDIPAGWEIGGWRNPGTLGHDRFGLYAEFSVGGVTQRCRWIAPGSLMMGSPADEKGRFDDEGPQHEVSLTGFWLADTACTQALWLAVMGENPSQDQRDPNNPVETVSWDDCRAFYEKINALVPGLAAGFPSEAQWEYACRAGTTTAYSFGQAFNSALANNGDKTVPVASLPANPWGLYEMHGNVLEWCADWYGTYAAEPQTDPEGPVQGMSRVLRGGSWLYEALYLRSASRLVLDPGYRSDSLGLRVAPGRAGPVTGSRPEEPSGGGRGRGTSVFHGVEAKMLSFDLDVYARYVDSLISPKLERKKWQASREALLRKKGKKPWA